MCLGVCCHCQRSFSAPTAEALRRSGSVCAQCRDQAAVPNSLSFPSSRLDLSTARPQGLDGPQPSNREPRPNRERRRPSVDETFGGQTSSLFGLALAADMAGDDEGFDDDLAITLEDDDFSSESSDRRLRAPEGAGLPEPSAPGSAPQLLHSTAQADALDSGEHEITAEGIGLSPPPRSPDSSCADAHRPLHKRRMSRWQLVLANARRHTNR